MEQLQGADAAEIMLEALPNAAQHEFQDLMGRLGRDILAIMQGRTPKDTGNLAAGLTSQLIVEDKLVRLRVGLLGIAATSSSARRRAAKSGQVGLGNLGGIYYGRFVEFGRAAMTVLRRIRRLNGNTSPENLKRRIRKKVGSYKLLNVAAEAPRPFVNVADGAVDQVVDERLQTFWDRALARAEGS